MKTITLEVSSVTLNILNVEKEGKERKEDENLLFGEEDSIYVVEVDPVQFVKDWSSVDLSINVNAGGQKQSYI